MPSYETNIVAGDMVLLTHSALRDYFQQMVFGSANLNYVYPVAVVERSNTGRRWIGDLYDRHGDMALRTSGAKAMRIDLTGSDGRTYEFNCPIAGVVKLKPVNNI